MASAASDAPSEDRELSLLDKVELRIALADTDNKLQALLKTYLVPVLVKLTSPHLKVRNKVRIHEWRWERPLYFGWIQQKLKTRS